MFRSLARRRQSLLHRQLTLLDQMERRASDPEALDDLFRLDHLTTRMRRHAEGLVILAAPPGRGWSSPVRMVDVMRGAIAEVEDYARVSVATRSQAALAGSAVADVIHLLAELIENATTLSPPYTSVRVSGDTVANGFAIEVEDRGLGMSPARLAELNGVAHPPEFNPSDTEQLGLFVVGQLAKRHGIRVTLKASPYGGTAAIVLIPGHLVVTEEAFRAGLPGEPAVAQLTANGNHAPDGHGIPGSGLTGSSTAAWSREPPDSREPRRPRASASPGRCAAPGNGPERPLERTERGAHAAPPPALAPANGTNGLHGTNGAGTNGAGTSGAGTSGADATACPGDVMTRRRRRPTQAPGPTAPGPTAPRPAGSCRTAPCPAAAGRPAGRRLPSTCSRRDDPASRAPRPTRILTRARRREPRPSPGRLRARDPEVPRLLSPAAAPRPTRGPAGHRSWMSRRRSPAGRCRTRRPRPADGPRPARPDRPGRGPGRPRR